MRADLKGDIGAQPLLSFVCFLAPMSDHHSLPQAPSTMHTQLNYSRVMDRDQGLSGTCEPNQMVPPFYCLLQVCCSSMECRLILVCGYNCPDSEKPLFIFSRLICQPQCHTFAHRGQNCAQCQASTQDLECSPHGLGVWLRRGPSSLRMEAAW